MTTELPFDIIPGSTIVMYTTSPDKAENYRQICKSYNVNFFTLDELGIPAAKTKEAASDYAKHTDEKADKLVSVMGNAEIQRMVYAKLTAQGIDTENVIGMTDDSGWKLVANTKAENAAVQAMMAEVKTRIAKDANPKRQNFDWMFKAFERGEFPGPDLKPIVEHLKGGLHELVSIIHEKLAAHDLETIRYENHMTAQFVKLSDPTQRKTVEGESSGNFPTAAQWQATLQRREDRPGFAITYDNLMYPDGQSEPRKTRAALLREGFLSNPNHPAQDYRKNGMAKLNLPLGKDKKFKNTANPRIAIVHGSRFQAGEDMNNGFTAPKGFDLVRLPNYADLLSDPNLEPIAGTDICIIQPSLPSDKVSEQEAVEDTVQSLLLAVVSKLIHPESKNKTILADASLDEGREIMMKALRIFDQTYLNGLANGTSPIVVAQDEDSRTALLVKAKKDFKSLFPNGNYEAKLPKYKNGKDPVLKWEPPANTFSVFVGGGAANNAPAYTGSVNHLAQFIASQGWALVTGGGQLDGPMGAAQAGFMEYHLSNRGGKDNKLIRLLEDPNYTTEEKDLLRWSMIGRKPGEHKPILAEDEGRQVVSLNVTKLLKSDAGEALLEKIGKDPKYIPPDRFFAFNMQYLMEAEGNGKPTIGADYQEAGNIFRRMHAMLKADCHVYTPGAHGTGQELLQSLILNRMLPECKKKDIILFNKDGALNHLIEELGLKHGERNVQIYSTREEVQAAAAESAAKHAERRNRDDTPSVAVA